VKKAVVGISARHTLSIHLKIPPIKDVQTRHDTIKLQLERKVEVDFSQVVFDYDDYQQGGDNDILVMVVLKDIISQIKEFLDAAKITPIRIVSTPLGFAPLNRTGVECNIIEFPNSVEACLFRRGIPNTVQYISKKYNTPLTAVLAQKVVRQVNRDFWLSDDQDFGIRYYLWSYGKLSDSQKDQFRQVFGNVQYKSLTVSSGNLLCDLSAELGGQVLLGGQDGINFLNGRHTEAKPSLIKRQLKKILAAVVLGFVLISMFVVDWHSDHCRIIELQEQLNSMKENVEVANNLIEQVRYTRQWFRQDPQYLEILRELSLAFPENEDIWLTSLAVDESFNQILTGRTMREEAILDVVETLRSRGFFDEIKILYIRKMGKGTNVMTFAINLRIREEQ